MVAKSVDIGTNALLPYEANSRQLILEWAPSHLHALLWNSNTKSVEAVESFHGEIADEDDWQSVLGQSRLLQLSDVETLLLAAGPRALPIPAALYDAERSAQEIDLLLGSALWQHSAGDLIPDYNLVLAWQMPASLFAMLQQHFSVLTHRHLLGQLLQWPVGENIVGHVVIAEKSVLCALRNQDGLLYAGSIPVLAADDLAYRLLNICRQHNIPSQDVHWQLSGTIETNSPLYIGIDHFLQQLAWMPIKHAMPAQAPSHYFAHLLQVLP